MNIRKMDSLESDSETLSLEISHNYNIKQQPQHHLLSPNSSKHKDFISPQHSTSKLSKNTHKQSYNCQDASYQPLNKSQNCSSKSLVTKSLVTKSLITKSTITKSSDNPEGNVQIPKGAIQKSKSIKQTQRIKRRKKRFNFQQSEQAPQIVIKGQTRTKPKLGNGQFPPQSTILVTTWNVNGIRFSIYKNHLSYYINQTKPDILCLTETKMDEVSFNKYPITVFGYNGYWNFCKCSLGYSGVVVFSKFEPIQVIEGIPEKPFMHHKQKQNQTHTTNQYHDYFNDDFDQQGRVLTLEFKDFYLVTVYTPAAGKDLQRLNYKCKQFEPRLFAFCQQLMTIKQVIIAGDLNTALTQLDTHLTKNTIKGPAFTLTERQSLQLFINKNNLIDAYRFKNPTKKQFTWWHIKYFGRQYAIGKRLDYFLLTEGLKRAIVSSEIKEKFKGSDHSPVQLTLDLRRI